MATALSIEPAIVPPVAKIAIFGLASAIHAPIDKNTNTHNSNFFTILPLFVKIRFINETYIILINNK
ncbi:hypothetical protein B10767_00280 [Campylobacter jejuni]|nr:hypothetical protein B10767_00280 [Campylobacter jejuni]BEK21730.1 hypothetical protein B11253_00290 [Campylobacter jejuni]BEK25343.1 hypothetical protein B11348_00280 [Campylobacter jejuni]GKT38881.1 hypothetical protein LOCUS_08960 [Campylobacter jejuni]GML58258.1 hypothetical protein B10440_07320 [Campylobacter jejuni]